MSTPGQRVQRERPPGNQVRGVVPTLIYVVVVLAIVAFTTRLGDRQWLATVLLFAPRWPYALPIVVLVPWAALGRGASRVAALGALIMTGLVLLWFNDLHVSPRGLVDPPQVPKLRVMSYNIGGGTFSAGTLVNLVQLANLDVAGLAECQNVDEAAFAALGYRVKKDVSGLCLVTRLPILAEDVRDPHDMWDRGGAGCISRYELDFKGTRISVLLVHLETPREGLEELRGGVLRPGWKGPDAMRAVIAQRELESRLAREWAAHATVPTIVMGDFNMPEDSAIYRANWSTFHNALGERGSGNLVTKATRWHGIRIDHVLFDEGWTCHKATIGEHLGMDHRPVHAELSLLGP